jgi:DNA (cytosine-5)-methyltransferase 1
MARSGERAHLGGENQMARDRQASTKRAARRKPTVLSMFAGCGGMDLGFQQAGFDLVWANEWDADAVATYQRNLCTRSSDHMHPGDISAQVVPNSLKRQVDVLLGGFPCQAFSNAGSRRGVEDDRGLLYRHCMRFIDGLRPRFVVFENVRGMLTIPGRRKRFVEEVCDELFELGYEVHVGLVNAAFYGVPQNRLRTVIVGVDHAQGGDIVYRFPGEQAASDLTLRSLLRVSKDLPNQQDVMRLNPQAYEIGQHVPEGGSWKDIPDKHLPERLMKIRRNMAKYRWPNFYRRFSRDEIAGTITAAFKPENAGVWHPTLDRTFSVREVARIQSFPDDFVFEARSVKSMYQMIGNAVPPRMAEAFGRSILSALEGKVGRTPLRTYQELRKRGEIIRPIAQELIYQPKSAPQRCFEEFALA